MNTIFIFSPLGAPRNAVQDLLHILLYHSSPFIASGEPKKRIKIFSFGLEQVYTKYLDSNIIIIQTDIKKAGKTKSFTGFFGADDEICAFSGAPRRTVGDHCPVCVIKCAIAHCTRKLLASARTSDPQISS